MTISFAWYAYCCIPVGYNIITLLQRWTDERLRWNPSYYPPSAIQMSPDDVWTPEVSTRHGSILNTYFLILSFLTDMLYDLFTATKQGSTLHYSFPCQCLEAPGSFPYEVPTPNNEDPLAGPYTEHRSCLLYTSPSPRD